MIQELSSPSNAKFKTWASLLESRGIKKEGLAILSGPKVVKEILQQQPLLIEDVLLPPKSEPIEFSGPQTRLSAELFKTLDVIGTHSALAVVRVPEIKPWSSTNGKADGLELILALSDPSNLGSCLRSAEAFGVTRVILTRESSSPFLPKALRAASGSSFRLQLFSTGPLAELPTLENLVGLDMQGESLRTYVWSKNTHLVLGEEGQGLPKSLNLKTIAIPIAKTVESLNATVAAATAMFSYRLKFD